MLSQSSIGENLRLALNRGMIREQDTAVIFYDLDFLAARMQHLCACFPAGTLHGLAVKANPLIKVMEFSRGLSPEIGVEAASIGEVSMALTAGYHPGQVVFDSPVKTEKELADAINLGVRLNIDNLTELDRVGKILDRIGPDNLTGSVGLRINPQVGVGSILESSVAGEYSKFGVPMRNRMEIEKAFLTYPWLKGVHLHIGSQGCPVDMLVNGIGLLYDFVGELNDKREKSGFPKISVFDIGGGLPISYRTGSPAPSMKEYAGKIALRAPALFDPSLFMMITEFGRWTYTNSGWTVSRVEYVKHDPAVHTAMIHVGADLFVRECLNPKDWQHEYSVFDRHGWLKEGTDNKPYNLAGPLCFSGDILAKNLTLPVIEEGDYIVIHDTGGYTFSMWSRYNSRQTPRILGYRNGVFEILKERETVEEVAGFWGYAL